MSEQATNATGASIYGIFYRQYIGEGKPEPTAKRLAMRASNDYLTAEEIQQIMSDTLPAQSAEEQSALDNAYQAFRAEGKDEATAMRMAKKFVGC